MYITVKAQTPTVSGTSGLTDGDTTTVTCSSGSSPLSGATYEWYANAVLISGASSSTYTTPAVSISDDGNVYTCKVIFNTVTSDISSTSVTLTGELKRSKRSVQSMLCRIVCSQPFYTCAHIDYK